MVLPRMTPRFALRRMVKDSFRAKDAIRLAGMDTRPWAAPEASQLRVAVKACARRKYGAR